MLCSNKKKQSRVQISYRDILASLHKLFVLGYSSFQFDNYCQWACSARLASPSGVMLNENRNAFGWNMNIYMIYTGSFSNVLISSHRSTVMHINQVTISDGEQINSPSSMQAQALWG